MKLALAVAALLFATVAHADGSDVVVNISTNNIVFGAQYGSTQTETLALSMQEDITTGTILSFSGGFTQGPLAGLDLTAVGSGDSFLLEGGGILMNFGKFDYDVEEYYPNLQFPLPGQYGPDIFYNNNNYVGGTYIASWPESGSVSVTDPTNVPEPSEYAMLIAGIGLAVLRRWKKA